MTANISAEAMRALRPHMDSDQLTDETLRRISEETRVPLDELRAARDALWHNSLGRPSSAKTRSTGLHEDLGESTDESSE